MNRISLAVSVAAFFALALSPSSTVNHGGHTFAPPAPAAHELHHDQAIAVSSHDVQKHHADVHNGQHVSHPAGHIDAEHIAINDMHDAALHALGTVTAGTGRFGTAADWTADWELRWIDYELDGRTIRVYHALNTHNHQYRYVAVYDEHRVHDTDWQLVR